MILTSIEMDIYLIYFLQTSLGIVLFYFLYLFFLKNETFYHINRYFLLTGLIVAVFIPFFPASYETTIPLVNNSDFFLLSESTKIADNAQVTEIKDTPGFWLHFAQPLVILYLAGMAFFFIRLAWQTIRISWKIRHSNYRIISGIKIIDQPTVMPFSFFNVVFIDIQEYSERELSNIIAHEKVHILERHWIDLLIMELLAVLFWMNPVVWLYERSIKQNHEYLADQGVLLAGYSPGQYQALLINQLMGVKVLGFAHNLNFSLNKKRMEMMKKEKSPRAKKIKLLLVLPVVALLVFAFAKPKFKVLDPQKFEKETNSLRYDGLLITVHGKVVDEAKYPMPGANVVLNNTSNGTVVDLDGTFKIEIPVDGELVISFVGYKTVRTMIPKANLNGNNAKLSVQLEKRTFNIHLPETSDEEIIDVPPPPPPTKDEDGKEEYVIVEEMPYYGEGGMYQLAVDLKKETGMMTEKTKDRGEVLVGFTLTTKGQIHNPHIVKSSESKTLDASALKIVSKLNNWKPGKQRGKAVNVDLTVPVNFN